MSVRNPPWRSMDSMLAIEIKVALERDFEIFLSAKEIRTMTLARLKEIQEEKMGARGDANKKVDRNFRTEIIFKISAEDLNDKLPRVVPEVEKSTLPKAVLFPGVEGFAGVLEGLFGRLTDVRIVQYVPDGQSTSVTKIVKCLFPTVKKLLPQSRTFFFVAYSYGVLIALEMVDILESQGYLGTLICIDGAPLLSKNLVNSLNTESKHQLLIGLICQLLSFFIPQDEIVSNMASIAKCETWEESINFAAEVVKNYDADKACCLEKVANAIYQRHLDLNMYQPNYGDLKSDIKLFRPTLSVIQDIEEDYELSRFFRRPVEIQHFEGNHQTILENEKLIDALNLFFEKLT